MFSIRFRSQLMPVLVASLLAACAGEQPARPERGLTPGGGRPVAVLAVPVQARPYTDEFTALGTARANESVEITSRTASIVTHIRFEEGQEVEAGQLLIELDRRELEADLAMAEASLRKVASQFERGKALAKTRIISEAELEGLEAELMIAEAEVRAARARLQDAYIRAPFAGTVGLRRVSVGDLVGPDTLITTLDDLRILKLEFTVPEVFIGTLRAGMPIEAHSTVYPQRSFKGEVRTIDSRVDPATRSVAVVAALPNPERLIRPGMFLTVDLQRRRDEVLLVPEQALVPRQGRQYVYVVEDGKAIEREVELGIRAPGLAEVRQGLRSGELVITEGTQKVRPGTPVRIAATG